MKFKTVRAAHVTTEKAMHIKGCYLTLKTATKLLNVPKHVANTSNLLLVTKYVIETVPAAKI